MILRYTNATQDAYAILRSPSLYQWYIVPLIVLIIYIYSLEVKKNNWNRVLCGISFCCCEFIWEMFNALVGYFSGYAALWVCSTQTAYMITIGLTIEIEFFFAIFPLIIFNFLDAVDKDKNWKILGLEINNRRIIPLLLGLACVFVEIMLNRWGALIWEWWWWNWNFPFLQIVAYSAPIYLIAWVYDNKDVKFYRKATPIIVALTIVLFIFLSSLGWI